MSEIIDYNFKLALENIKPLVNNINNDEKAFLYKYYKQATFGDVNIPKPTGLFNIIDKQKWEAWNSLKGTNPSVAKKVYTHFVNDLIGKYK